MPRKFMLLIFVVVFLLACRITDIVSSKSSPTPTPNVVKLQENPSANVQPDSSSETSHSPEDVYNIFQDACNKGDIATAESLVTQEAKMENQEYGVCILTPDGANKIAGTDIIKLIDSKPKVELSGNTAYLIWRSDAGDFKMALFKDNNTWKIRSAKIY